MLEEAVRVFDDGREALELFDEQHSSFEERFITIGPIHSGLVLVVWTERVEDVIRLVSARFASPAEQRLYRRHVEQLP
ncbi:MAG: BrnT family toxin [Myxococcales bacterium]|nr:BrnT family toxin [Myxococcales bacterium]